MYDIWKKVGVRHLGRDRKHVFFAFLPLDRGHRPSVPVELCDGLAAREAAQVPDAERAVVSAAYHEVVDEAGEEGGGGGVGGGGGGMRR